MGIGYGSDEEEEREERGLKGGHGGGGASVDRLGLSCLLAVRSAIPDKRETAEAQHHVGPAHQEPGGVEEQEREGPWQVSAAGSGSGLPVQGQGQGPSLSCSSTPPGSWCPC